MMSEFILYLLRRARLTFTWELAWSKPIRVKMLISSECGCRARHSAVSASLCLQHPPSNSDPETQPGLFFRDLTVLCSWTQGTLNSVGEVISKFRFLLVAFSAAVNILKLWGCMFCLHEMLCSSPEEQQHLPHRSCFSVTATSCGWLQLLLLTQRRTLRETLVLK